MDIAGGNILIDLFRHYFNDESGATVIEYSVFGVILVAVLISILGTGGGVDDTYQKLRAVTSALNGTEPVGQTGVQGQVQTQTGLVNQ